MNAHQLDANGVILNTIVVDDLMVFPNLVDATIGGSIGDTIINGVVTKAPLVITVPESVTMRQARLALLGAGLLANVDTAINSLASPAKEQARIEWDYSSDVQRHRSLVSTLGAALGLTEAQLDALFIKAATL